VISFVGRKGDAACIYSKVEVSGMQLALLRGEPALLSCRCRHVVGILARTKVVSQEDKQQDQCFVLLKDGSDEMSQARNVNVSARIRLSTPSCLFRADTTNEIKSCIRSWFLECGIEMYACCPHALILHVFLLINCAAKSLSLLTIRSHELCVRRIKASSPSYCVNIQEG
jgi:hypothetical protein